eukprot:3903813-Pleurochrysis_carterae.AAC.5
MHQRIELQDRCSGCLAGGDHAKDTKVKPVGVIAAVQQFASVLRTVLGGEIAYVGKFLFKSFHLAMIDCGRQRAESTAEAHARSWTSVKRRHKHCAHTQKGSLLTLLPTPSALTQAFNLGDRVVCDSDTVCSYVMLLTSRDRGLRTQQVVSSRSRVSARGEIITAAESARRAAA